MRVSLAPAYVLHQRAYQETSKLVEVFSRDFGRVGLIAKGARRSKSPWRGVLEPLQPLLLSWTGRGELPTLTHAELSDVQGQLPGQQVYSALYLNELLMRLVSRRDPHPQLFDVYGQTLSALSDPTAPRLALRLFERDLLAEIGYGLELERDCKDGAAIEAGEQYTYVLDQGPMRSGDPNWGVRVSGRTLLALGGSAEFDAQAERESKVLLRHLLQAHLGDKALETRRLFR